MIKTVVAELFIASILKAIRILALHHAIRLNIHVNCNLPQRDMINMPVGKFVSPKPLELAERNVKIARGSLYVFIGLASVIFIIGKLAYPDKTADLWIGFGVAVFAILAAILAVIQIEMAYYQLRQDCGK